MRFYCLGDEETVRGFRLAGVDGQVVTSAGEAERALAGSGKLLTDPKRQAPAPLAGLSRDWIVAAWDSSAELEIALEEKAGVLATAKDALKNEYDNLLKEKMDLATKLEIVTNEKAALKSEYDKILDEKIAVKAAYDTLLAGSKR